MRLGSANEGRSHSPTDERGPGVEDEADWPRGGSGTAPRSRYVVVGEIGRGGMGSVLRAYDPTLQREVAIKIVREHALDPQAARRLVVEARAMARLSHPHVVSVYDVEEDASGRITVVMELVRGQTLLEWLRAQPRAWAEVVDRFVAAGRGLAAAHGAQLLHRDFKPANVLLGPGGMVKVTDFGLARSLLDGSPDRSETATGESDERLTAVGRVVGTARYMSPEQHQGLPLDATTDQYSFCVALWEALCGEPPFAGPEILAAKSKGPPRWPETKVPPVVVAAVVRGLAPIASQRWPTMDALLAALSRGSRRGGSRGWWAAGLGLSALGSVSWAMAADDTPQRCGGAELHLQGTWDDERRAEVEAAITGIERSYATEVWDKVRAELDGYAQAWSEAHTQACEAASQPQGPSGDLLDRQMGCLRRASDSLRAAVAVLADADAEVVERAHELTAGLYPLQRCSDLEALARQTEPPLPDEAKDVEAARWELAMSASLQGAGRYLPALEAARRAREISARIDYLPVRTEMLIREGIVLDILGEFEQAERSLRQGLVLAARDGHQEHLAVAARQLMYVVGLEQHRLGVATPFLHIARGAARTDAGLDAQLRASEAIMLASDGRFPESEIQHREAIAMREALDPHHPDVALIRGNLAVILAQQGKYAEAEVEARAALAAYGASIGPEHPLVARCRTNLANILASLDRVEEAAVEAQAAIDLWEGAVGVERPYVAVARINHATLLAQLGELERAEAEFRRATPMLAGMVGPDHPHVAAGHHGLANLLQSQGRMEEAVEAHRAALRVRETSLSAEHPELAQSRTSLAGVLLEVGRLHEALPLAERAWLRNRREDIPLEDRVGTALVLGRILWEIEGEDRDRPRAWALVDEARRAYADHENPDEQLQAQLEGWVATHVP